MDKDDVISILANHFVRYRSMSYAELRNLIGGVNSYEISAPAGNSYQVEFQVFWDDKPNGDLRIIGAIDDGGWRAFMPLCQDFIMAPDGSILADCEN